MKTLAPVENSLENNLLSQKWLQKEVVQAMEINSSFPQSQHLTLNQRQQRGIISHSNFNEVLLKSGRTMRFSLSYQYQWPANGWLHCWAEKHLEAKLRFTEGIILRVIPGVGITGGSHRWNTEHCPFLDFFNFKISELTCLVSNDTLRIIAQKTLYCALHIVDCSLTCLFYFSFPFTSLFTHPLL